jgi:LemA protein
MFRGLGKDRSMPTLLIVVAFVAVVVFMLVGTYNRLVGLRQNANQAFADIDVQLKQRQDLIPNLVETVKGYAAHESGTLQAVTQARAAAASAGTVEDKVAAENVLSGALRQLFAVSEAYPDLKANANFMQLQAELGDIENKLAAARRFFNNAVSEFNASIQQFPAVAVANAFGFQQRAFFDLGESRAAAEAAPQVKF